MSKKAFIANFQFSKILIVFKLSVASNTPENGGHDLSTSLIQMDNLTD